MIKENTVEQSTPSAILPMQCYVQCGDNYHGVSMSAAIVAIAP